MSIFLERIYAEDHKKMCHSLAHRLYEIDLELIYDEVLQVAYDLWWETFDEMNRRYRSKKISIESDEHARRIMYRMFPFIVQKFFREKEKARMVDNSYVYLNTFKSKEREQGRSRKEKNPDAYSRANLRRRENAKKWYYEMKKDPVRYQNHLRRLRVQKAIKASKDKSKEWADALLEKEGIKYDKIEQPEWKNTPFEEALSQILMNQSLESEKEDI